MFSASLTRAARYGAPVLALLLGAQSLNAQEVSRRALTGRFSGAAHLLVTEPRGEFGQNTGNGVGVGASMIWRLDPQAIANWRIDLGILNYGNETRRIPLAGTGGLVKLDLRTTNNIFSLVTGPQLQFGNGPVTPYVAALGGFSVFWTESSVEGTQSDNTPFARTTNNSDAVLAYGGAVGTTLRVYNGSRPVRLDLGARFLRHDDVRYLNDQRVRDAFQQNRDPIPLRGRADFVTYFLGANVVVY